MSKCLGVDPIKKKFSFFGLMSFERDYYPPHDYTFFVEKLSWWTIHWSCRVCKISHEEWPLSDYELMKRFNLKRCPSGSSFSTYSEKKLEDFR